MLRRHITTALVALAVLLPAVVPARDAPASLITAEQWVQHARQDVLPWWLHPAALGEPYGRFPTFRCLDGRAYDVSAPCPELTGAPQWVRSELGRQYVRMQARQVFAYAVGFHLTGDVALLRHAKAGVDDIRTRALDARSGSAATYFDVEGRPQPRVGERTAQDLAYAGIALASYHYLTRDAAVLDDLDRLHRHVMSHFDEQQGHMRWTLTGEQRGELVAQLDPLNAYMVLTLPTLSGERRARWSADMRRLVQAIRTRYCAQPEPRCLGTLEAGGERPGARHNDFGHSGKAYWMVMLAGRQLGDAEMTAWARRQGAALLDQAYVSEDGTWASAWTADGLDESRSWWIHAELDQLAATLALEQPALKARFARTTRYWLERFVDRERGEVHGWLSSEGLPPPVSLKQHHWKNGYHSLEHALIGYIATQALQGGPATLHFAVDDRRAPLTPYLFDGRVIEREGVQRPGEPTVWRVRFDIGSHGR